MVTIKICFMHQLVHSQSIQGDSVKHTLARIRRTLLLVSVKQRVFSQNIYRQPENLIDSGLALSL